MLTVVTLDNAKTIRVLIPVQHGHVGSRFASCAICKKNLPPRHFDYRLLTQLEDDGEVYMAECLQCKDTLGSKERHQKKKIPCNLCGYEKPRSEFRIERQRSKNYQTWRCRSCDFTPCDTCGKIPTEITSPGYRCELCKWPPCACGRDRPRSSKYSTKTFLGEWKCKDCKSTR